MTERTFWVETLGCPKNQVDSDKLTGKMLSDGLSPADSADAADLIVVNTCAFIEEARQESIDVIFALDDVRATGAELVVTGCMAERYGAELAEAMPEADAVVGFGVPVSLASKADAAPAFDLLRLPRPPASAPWAYVKIAEGCDRNCGFCAIPSFRGPQRSRSIDEIVAETAGLDIREVVLVAQDLAAYGRDQGKGERQIIPLVTELAEVVDRVRLLYLYPSDLTDELIDLMCSIDMPYFDLSLQHVSRPHLRRMRRWGDADRFAERIAAIRRRQPGAAFRTNFIVGYPGETEEDQDALLDFVETQRLDWCAFFRYSEEDGTYAAELDDKVDSGLVTERIGELYDIQDPITQEKRAALIGQKISVLVDEAGIGRSFREAPEIDGIVQLPLDLPPGTIETVTIVDSEGPDVVADGAAESYDASQSEVE